MWPDIPSSFENLLGFLMELTVFLSAVLILYMHHSVLWCHCTAAPKRLLGSRTLTSLSTFAPTLGSLPASFPLLLLKTKVGVIGGGSC